MNKLSNPNHPSNPPDASVGKTADNVLARNAYNISIMLLIASVPSIGIFIYYGLTFNVPEILIIAGIMFLASFGAVAALFLIPRGRSNLAMMIIITSFTITFLTIPFLIQGLGIVLALLIFILTVSITGLALPTRYAISGLIVGLVSGTLILLLDNIILGSERLSFPQLERAATIITVAFTLFFIVFGLRQFKRFSLRIKIALSILLTGGIAVASITAFGLYRANTMVNLLTAKYEEVSETYVEQQIADIIEVEADKANAYFSKTVSDLAELSDYRATLESEKALFSEGQYWDAETSLIQYPGGQYGNAAKDIAAIFIPSTVAVDETVFNDLNTSAYLDFYAPNFLKMHPDVAAVYFISKTGSTTYYPNINIAKDVPADFDATQQTFYTVATPENNPQREPRWTVAYDDPAGNGLITTLSIPVYFKDKFLGVMSLDMQLDKIAQNIATIQAGQTGYAFVVDQAGHIIVMSPNGYTLYGIPTGAAPENPSSKVSVLAKGPLDLQEATARMINGETGTATISVNNSDYYITFAPIETPNYRLAIVVPENEFTAEFTTSKNEIQKSSQSALQGITILLISLLIVAILVSLWVGQLITRPLVSLTRTAETIAQGDFTARADVNSYDETGVLATSFNSMAERLNDAVTGLEKRVSERTQELETANEGIVRRAAQFESIARVARTISSTQTLDALLPQIAGTISEQFGFYHVGIFLLDTHSEYAILVAANSEGGQKMLARSHRLLVGGAGIVGFVTNAGQPRVALDVGLDAAFFNNPDLPDTHSEIALPLRIGKDIIGALDVQSIETNAFSQEDVSILSTLADQVAIAIQNARSYQQSREALAQAETASTQMSGQQWKRFFADQPVEGYSFDGIEARDLKPSDKELAHSLAIPLTLRGIRIGTLKLSASDPNRTWTEDEIAMAEATAERTALAVESARLLQEAHKRAAKERTIGDISAKIGSLVNIENILQTAIQELGNTMPNTDIAIQFKKDQETE